MQKGDFSVVRKITSENKKTQSVFLFSDARRLLYKFFLYRSILIGQNTSFGECMYEDKEYKKGQKVLVTKCEFGHGVGEKLFLCVCEFVGREIVLGEKLSGVNIYPIKGSKDKLILPSEFRSPDEKA